MKKRRNLKERLMAFLMTLIMVASTLFNPIQISAESNNVPEVKTITETPSVESSEDVPEVPVDPVPPSEDPVDPIPNPVYAISGQILCGKQPVVGATVSIEGQNSVVTGDDGKYSFDLEDGTYTINASREGFSNNSKSITVAGTASETNDISLTLKPLSLNKPDTQLYVGESTSWTVSKELTAGNFVWSSNNTDVATVDDGKIQAVNPGIATITVSVENAGYDFVPVSADVKILTDKTLTSIKVTPPTQPDEVKNIESVNLEAVVKAKNSAATIASGNVTFIVEHENTQGTYEQVETKTVNVENGSASFTFLKEKNKLGLTGNYRFSANFLGTPGYSESGASPVEANYTDMQPIAFLNPDNSERLDFTEPINIVYGSTYAITIDKAAFLDAVGDVEESQVKYSFKVLEDAAKSSEVLAVDEDGNVSVLKYTDSPIYVRVTRDKIGSHAATFVDVPFTVSKKVITIDTSYAGLTYSKVYDKNNFTVKNSGETEDVLSDVSLIPLKDVEESDAGKVKVGSVEGTMPNTVIDAKEYKGILLTLTSVTLTGDAADNYSINFKTDNHLTLDTVTIKQRPIRVQVVNGTREYGHYDEITYDAASGAVVTEWTDEENKEIEGFVEEDTAVEWPTAKEIEIPDGSKPDYTPSKTSYSNKLSVVENTGNAGDNYKFDFEFDHIKKGALTVTKAKISQDQYRKYVDYSNNSNAFISKTDMESGVYGVVFASDANTAFQVNVQNGNIKGKDYNPGYYYDSICLKDGTIISNKDGGGIDLTGLSGEQSYEVYLNNAKNGAKSEVFTINIVVDSLEATVDETSISNKNNPVLSAINAITFGKFFNESDTKEASVTVSDPEFESDTRTGSGVKTWYYNVMSGDDANAFTKEAIETYASPLTEKGKWNTASDKADESKDEQAENLTLDNIPIKADEGNYVLLIRVVDNVGHDVIYTSNGYIIDYAKPSATISISEKNTVDSGVYGGDVTLDITLDDIVNKSASVSAIKYAYVKVTHDGLYDENADKTDIYTIPNGEDTKGQSWNLADIQSENELAVIHTQFVVDSKKYNTNDIQISVVVTDNAGNEYTTDPYALKIDTTVPKLEYTSFTTVEGKKVNPNTFANVEYYKNKMQMVITYTERNFSNLKEYLWFNVTTEGSTDAQANYSYTQLADLNIKSEWITEGVDTQDDKDDTAWTDARSHKLKLTFDKDDHYVITPYIQDNAMTPAEEKDTLTHAAVKEERKNFVVDTVAPVLSVSYKNQDGANVVMPDSEKNRYYTSKNITASLKINEHNFYNPENNTVPVDASVQTKAYLYEYGVPKTTDKKTITALDAWSNVTDEHTVAYLFDGGASVGLTGSNYVSTVAYKDLAGNQAVTHNGYFTVDKNAPTGTIKVGSWDAWKQLLSSITFGLFSNTTVNVALTGADETSPVISIEHARFHDAKSLSELQAFSGWSVSNSTSVGYSVSPDEQFVVYSKVTDAAKNVTYLSSNGVIVDKTKPGPKVTITNLSQAQNGIFNENVQLRIDVEDPTVGNTYSGLEKVWYTVAAAGNVTKSETITLMDNSNNKVQGHKTFSQVITVPANVYNSNDVKVQAFATDFSSNQGQSEVTPLKIDVTNPTISVAWDLNNPLNGKYYKDTRTATVTVTDRNFDENNVRFTITNTDGTSAQIGGWSTSSSMGVSDSATATCQVAFPADGDYTFTLGCTDLAGNSGEYGQTDSFTIDKTVPVISVSYDNNNAKNSYFYKEKRVATITIKEHNFNASEVRADITTSLQGQGITTPSVSSFSNGGDTHTASVTYEADGDYTFDVSYADLAGNAAADYTKDSFTVDKTAPEVNIVDIVDKSANNNLVAPGVTYTDVNFDEKGATITLTGANKGETKLNQTQTAIANGQSIKMGDFPHTEDMDDLYTYQARVEDKAGNVTEKSVRFSVNRYGSVYVLDDDTKAWLSTSEDDYTYINKEEAIGIIEYNVDTVSESKITSNLNGDLTDLAKNADYMVKESGGENEWKEYHYQISKDNFKEEGNYTLTLYSQDAASNTANNLSVKHADKNLPLKFAVDKTAPTVVVSGVEDRGQYRSANRVMTVDAKDNLLLEEVDVVIDGKSTTYNAEELQKMDGVISTDVNRANNWQTIEITARDAAGNDLGTVNSENGTSEEKASKISLTVLVTPNVLIQYYMNKPLFFGSIGGVVVLVGLIILLIFLKKRKQQQG